MTSPDPWLERLLHSWLPRQRWYPAKGRGVSIHSVGGRRLDGPADPADSTGGVALELHVLALDSGDQVDVVQVPLSYRDAPLEGAEQALVGRLPDGDRGERWVYDGPHDPVYVQALLGELETAPGTRRPDPRAPARVLAGEQSNTSIIVGPVEGPGGADAFIVKVFRTLHPGANPDVEVAAALAAVGCERIARPVGWLSGTWTDVDGGPATGHLAVASEFLAGSQDAWREAVTAVQQGDEFASAAEGLGEATAVVHLALIEAFGATAMTVDVREHLVAGLRARVSWALASAPALAPHAGALDRHLSALDRLVDLPDLQRVHGDYHLGQVLHSPERGWILLDFEGEPLRPLRDRVLPDLALRDVAGMLRSFDYAARHAGAQDGYGRQWAAACRDAFCDGYGRASGHDPRERADVLSALELDKALYEVVYETRNRPEWLDVPLRAVERLLG